jgi:hypothetical protein
MWPLSFTQVKRKIKEYRKKNKKDLGLDGLEFTGEPNSKDSNDYKDNQSNPIPDPALEVEYQLPPLPKPASYSDYVF